MTSATFPPAIFSQPPPRKRWTRDECEKLEMYGLLEAHRYELIEGDLIDKLGKNQPHIIWLALFQAWFTHRFAGRVLAEATLDVSPEAEPTSEPQPDLMVLRSPITAYLERRPRPADVELLLEVADSTIGVDTVAKARLYARAGIADYWVVDVNARRLLVFREPREGEYQAINTYEAHEPVNPLAAPDAQLRINDILPAEN